MTEPAYFADGRHVARDRFYAIACDPRRSAIVEACAGAGKTWMLVSRILRALLDGAAPHEILAITFTRKAAGEMRARLDEWLRTYAAPGCDDATRAAALVDRGMTPAEAARAAPKLAALRATLIAGGRPVEIRTFHAWFAQLLQGAPIEALAALGLPADMELVEDASAHRAAVFRRFHAALLADPELRADHDALVAGRGRAQVRKWLEAAWDRHVEVELADRAGVLETSVPRPTVEPPDAHPGHVLAHPAWHGELRAIANRLETGHSRARDAATGILLALETADVAARFQQLRHALFTQQGNPRKLGDVEALADLHDRLERLADDVCQHDAHLEHGRMVRLARRLLAEYAAYKRARGLADMPDLERAGLALLGEAALAGWVQERLDMRVRHVLIDEFQDTSPLQWHALHAWLAGYAGAGGGASGQRPPGVFIVGDPKQSIYRFRRADPRVFEAAQRFVVEALEGRLLACDHTRRNTPEVIAALNAVFGAAGGQGAFDGFRPHTTEVEAGGEAGLDRLPRTVRPEKASRKGAAEAPKPWRDTLVTPRRVPEEVLREQEAACVAAAVVEALAGAAVAAGEIFVLCRSREPLRLVAAALQARGVPTSAIEDTALMEVPEARDLVALLDALVSPRHRLSLAQALKSPLFGASDDDLLALAALAAHGDWWDAVLRGRWDGAGAAPARPALHRAQALLPRWRQAAAALPPHDLLDRIVDEGELRERVAAAVPPLRRVAALAAIDAVVGQALTLDGARYATPYGFVRAMKRGIVKAAVPADPAAVQLLTVHGAKGLEAELVFVVDAEPEHRNADAASLLIDWPVESDAPARCAFVYTESGCAPTLRALRDREIAARRREDLNLLYVAMSRARRRLVFSATQPFRAAEDVAWWTRIEPLARPLVPPPATGVASPAEGGPAAPLGADAAPPAVPPAVVKTLGFAPRRDTGRPGRPAPAAFASADDDAARRLGQAVHRVLEWAAPGPRRTDAPRPLAEMADAAGAEFGVATAAVAHLAGTILQSPACDRFFVPTLGWAGNEVTFAEGGELLRIDRLVRIDSAGGAPEWWVLDYKLQQSADALEAHHAQLRRYRRAVERAEPGARVRCAFLTGAGAVIEVD